MIVGGIFIKLKHIVKIFRISQENSFLRFLTPCTYALRPITESSVGNGVEESACAATYATLNRFRLPVYGSQLAVIAFSVAH